jgi:predicted nuclease with TOPRIM domain
LVSRPEDKVLGDPSDLGAFERLELAIDAALARVDVLQAELQASNNRAREMETLLKRFTGGEDDPASLLSRLQRLEDENGVLTERLRKGRDGVEKLLARIRFFEEQG